MCYRYARPFVQIFQKKKSVLFSFNFFSVFLSIFFFLFCKINQLPTIELLRKNMLFTSDRW